MKKRVKAEPIMAWAVIRWNKINLNYLYDTRADATFFLRGIKGDRIARIKLTEV